MAPALTMGLVLGAMEVMIAASFAALVFAGELAVHRGSVLAMVLFGGAVCILLLALRSSLPPAVATVQDAPAAVLALVGAGVAAAVPAGDGQLLTLVACLVAVTTGTGLVLYLLGRFHLGALIRYLPFPVVGGFLAGTGWLLLDGGLEVAGGVPVGLADPGALADGDVLLHLAPAVVLGVALVVASHRSDHLLALPGLLFTGIATFHVALALSGSDLEAARAAGWVAEAAPGGGIQWLAPAALAGADWDVVLRQAASLPTVVLVTAVGVLLGISAVEVDVARTADADRELRVAGVGNVVAGALGGMPGYVSASLSALNERAGGGGRPTGIVMAVVVAGAALLGPGIFSVVPLFVVGSLLVFLGLGFLHEWVVLAARRMPAAEYGVVLLILVVVAARGLLEAIGVGLVAAVLLFVVAYSRTTCIARVATGVDQRSRVLRTSEEVAVLRERGDGVLVVELQGFLFFGTIERVVALLRERVDVPGAPLEHLVLDLRRVTGLDASAVLGLTRVADIADGAGVGLVLTSAEDRVLARLRASGVAGDQVHVAEDLDHGMEWVEEQLLAGSAVASPLDVASWFARELGDAGAARRLVAHLEVQDLEVGEHLVRGGDTSTDLWFVASGGLEARVQDEGIARRVGVIRPGTVVGEVALYVGARSAALVATVPTRVHRLGAAVLADIERDEPHLAVAVHRMLATRTAERLVDQNRLLASLHG